MKYNENTSIHKIEIGNLIEDELLEMVEEGVISKEDGYKWVAVDKNGNTFYYTVLPHIDIDSKQWLSDGDIEGSYGAFTDDQLNYIENNWKDLLFEIGEKG